MPSPRTLASCGTESAIHVDAPPRRISKRCVIAVIATTVTRESVHHQDLRDLQNTPSLQSDHVVTSMTMTARSHVVNAIDSATRRSLIDHVTTTTMSVTRDVSHVRKRTESATTMSVIGHVMTTTMSAMRDANVSHVVRMRRTVIEKTTIILTGTTTITTTTTTRMITMVDGSVVKGDVVLV